MNLSPLVSAGLRVSTSSLDLDAYRRDLWPRATLALTGGALPEAPAAVVWPRDAEELALALELAGREGVAVVPYGAGSGVCGAAAGRAGSLVVDTKRMDAVGEVDPDQRAVRVGPGVLGQHLEDRLARQGWQVGHSPSSIWCSTVGGYAASRSAGQFSSRYGVFDDMLLGAAAQTPAGPLRAGVWTPDGQEDLLPVLVGSEGALGVLHELLVRVNPLPETRWLRGYAFSSVEAAWEAMRGLMQAGLWPAVLRLYDAVDSSIGGKLGRRRPREEGAGHGVLERIREAVLSVPGLRRHLLDLPLALPGLVNRLAANLGHEVLLIVGFEGPTALVDAAVEAAGPLLAAGRDLGPGPGTTWFAHRHDVSYKLAPIFAAGGFADTMEVAAPWSRLPGLYASVKEALGRHTFVMAHFSHAYPQGCSIYFSFAGAGRVDVYDRAWSDALEAAQVAGGTVTHHHGVGQLKAAAAAREAGAAVRVWRELKARLDPQGIMNPGRLFPDGVPEEPGPPPPQGGPVYAVDELAMLADVDPSASPQAIDAALAPSGLRLMIPPDRPPGAWLGALERGALEAWETPLFDVQARFSDGNSVRLGRAPRSAAGPDLRWSLLRRATVELVQLPLARVGATTLQAAGVAASELRAPGLEPRSPRRPR